MPLYWGTAGASLSRRYMQQCMRFWHELFVVVVDAGLLGRAGGAHHFRHTLDSDDSGPHVGHSGLFSTGAMRDLQGLGESSSSALNVPR